MFKQKSDPAATALSPADAVQQARTRARQRLIGAIVLLGIGIIGFPLVFETQPRPIPVDIPIEIPRKDTAPPLVAPPAPPSLAASEGGSDRVTPAAPPRSDRVTESHSDTQGDATPARGAASAALTSPSRTSNPVVAAASAAGPASTPVAQAADSARRALAPVAASTTKPGNAAANGDSDRARALLEGRPVAVAEASQRFVIQVGAFADADAARETRQKAEKLGLKTYTQVAQTPGGSRIRVRVGPFASRADAEAAQAKAKTAGLAAVVLTL
jgi:DedD protein